MNQNNPNQSINHPTDHQLSTKEVHEHRIVNNPELADDLLTAWNHHETVLLDPRLRLSKSPRFLFCFIYAGSVRVPLGYLLAQWHNHNLVTTCPHCNGDLLVYRVGSGLSFSVKTGLCTNCHQLIELKTGFDRPFLEPLFSDIPPEVEDEMKRRAAEVSKEKGKITYSGPPLTPLEDHGSIPLHAVSRLIRSKEAVDPVYGADNNILGHFNWWDNTLNLTDDSDAKPLPEIVEEVQEIYELQITDDVVYILEKGCTYLPRRYRLDRDRLLSYPELEVLARFKPGLPWQAIVKTHRGCREEPRMDTD